MGGWVWILIFILGALAVMYAGRLAVVHRDITDLAVNFGERVDAGSNTPLTTGSGDRAVRSAVRTLNVALAAYRSKRRRYEQGDTNLREKITNLAHDLRTPLTAVMGYLDVLEEDPGAVERYLPIMRGRIELMTALTGELFEYSLSTSGRPNRVQTSLDLRTLLEDAVIGLYPLFAEHDIEPEIQLPDTPVLCSTDRGIAERLIGNILTNAIRHGAGGVRIALDEDGLVHISNDAPDLEPLDLEKMFDRYYTVKGAGRTTGLGLGIAKTLTEELGGEIRASLGGGALEITLRLPRNVPDASRHSECSPA